LKVPQPACSTGLRDDILVSIGGFRVISRRRSNSVAIGGIADSDKPSARQIFGFTAKRAGAAWLPQRQWKLGPRAALSCPGPAPAASNNAFVSVDDGNIVPAGR